VDMDRLLAAATAAAAAAAASGNGSSDLAIVLPGLPLTESGGAAGPRGVYASRVHSLGLSSRGESGSLDGSGNGMASQAAAQLLASYPVGYTDVSDVSGGCCRRCRLMCVCGVPLCVPEAGQIYDIYGNRRIG
jgi:hypothetical protein